MRPKTRICDSSRYLSVYEISASVGLTNDYSRPCEESYGISIFYRRAPVMNFSTSSTVAYGISVQFACEFPLISSDTFPSTSRR
jgi:hypothetical protein